jgi:hypothetical protein
MRKLTRDEIVDIAAYERERSEFRRHVIDVKKRRRVEVGEQVTLVFENLDTMRFQIQEIMRAERIVIDERIQQELDIYNELLPEPGQLTATLFIEVSTQSRVKEVLDQMRGLDQTGTTYFQVGGGERVTGLYEGGHSHESKISAVHYVTFIFTETQLQTFVEGTEPLRLIIDHSNYRREVTLSDDVRSSLSEDLQVKG